MIRSWFETRSRGRRTARHPATAAYEIDAVNRRSMNSGDNIRVPNARMAMALRPNPDAGKGDAEGRYEVDVGRRAALAGDGVFVATDRHAAGANLIALQVARATPAWAPAFQSPPVAIDNLLAPLACVRAPVTAQEQGFFVICPGLPGPPVMAQPRPWTEAALIAQVLRPIAQVLVALEARGLTHRAIRPDNVFDAGPNRPVVLGPAWAGPPGLLQPPAFEPPYSAVCHRAGRGQGQIADDVYALGALLIALAGGRMPLHELTGPQIVSRKLSMGSFAALAGDMRLPPLIADLARNMLAEDPEHRPPPALLMDPAAAGGRRVAARPPARAQRPLMIGGTSIWDSRTLAYTIGMNPTDGLSVLRSGEAMQWLRRGLGDAGLAVRLEELERHRAHDGPAEDPRADAVMIMRAVAQIDVLAPLFWRGVAFWPDGLGPLLAAARAEDAPLTQSLAELVALDGIAVWAMHRADRCDDAALRLDGRMQRDLLLIKGASGGVSRLLYSLNPMLPCASPLLGGAWVHRPQDILPALNATAQGVDTTREPLDPQLIAFVAARVERSLESEVEMLNNGRLDDAGRLLAQVRLIASLQGRYWPAPLPALAEWLVARAGPLVALWHNRAKREDVAAKLNALASAGFLSPILSLIEDPVARAADQQGAADAAAQLARIDSELRLIANGAPGRLAQAERIGQEIAAAAGLTLLAVVLVLVAVG